MRCYSVQYSGYFLANSIELSPMSSESSYKYLCFICKAVVPDPGHYKSDFCKQLDLIQYVCTKCSKQFNTEYIRKYALHTTGKTVIIIEDNSIENLLTECKLNKLKF